MSRTLAAHARLLIAMTRVEVAKKYAGSVLGTAWLFLQPALLLSVYLFVYMVVFKLRFPGFSRLDYVLFVFAGLVPYIGSMEAVTVSVLSVKANMHLVKNVMLPVELVPVRTVLVALVSELVALGLVLLLSAFAGSLSPALVALPLVVVFQAGALLGVAWIVSGIGVALPDMSYLVNLFMFLLMFISPIAFRPDMVPPSLRFVVYANPVHYMIEVFRDCLVSGRSIDPLVWTTFFVSSVVVFAVGAAFFKTFKTVLVDYE
jgi:lipopolysaccharide transport system permease protein